MEAAALTLSPRLRAIAELVPPGARVADVGTDHAQLLAWLVAHGRASAGIGIDVNAGPLVQARRTLAAAAVRGVELRRGDGLCPLSPGEVDVVVIAGMGGARIVRLLEAGLAVVEGLDALVLQPNTEWAVVRRWIAAHRLQLAREVMVEDRGKFYAVLVVQPRASGEPIRWTDEALELGPRLVVERSPAFVAWLRHELERTERAAARRQDARRSGPASDLEPGADPQLTALRRRSQWLHLALDHACSEPVDPNTNSIAPTPERMRPKVR